MCRLRTPLGFLFFLLAALAVAGVLGYLSGFFGPWAVVVGEIQVMILLTIEIGRKVLKRDRL